ncbi:hypothetical protein DERP_005061 [Dermatophagoides pteronyssinus]|uniref:Pseudouridine synthase RsuA/RluA-like domain-containing protein n=1 Tax=Dermatophagoides pteronyssinus TaxID=6956 RepID=A0ABQ8JTC4_DERPT|nr:hypothetical protein DERP_005061 [Dermatophagoides pteronyssinus]
MFKRQVLFVLNQNLIRYSSLSQSTVTSSLNSATNRYDNDDGHQHKSINKRLSSSSKHLYRNLFDWNSQIDLAKLLAKNIVYNDYGLIAISKPWGLGIHKPADNVIDLKNPSNAEQILNNQIFGQPKYSIADVIDLFGQLMHLNHPLHIVKAPDRRWSGLVLFSEEKTMENHILKAIRRAKAQRTPPMRFYCVVNGLIPSVEIGRWYEERCGIRLTEIDELGQSKEPIYVSPNDMSHNIRKKGAHRDNKYQLGPVKSASIKYRVLAQNPDLAVSLIDLHTTITKWSAIQCFLAYKTSFILGDTFFSYRVKHIFGQHITMSTLKQKNLQNWRHIDQSFEPLSRKVCQKLGVRSNREIPLMIHHYGLLFPKLLRTLRPLKRQSNHESLNDQTNQNLIKLDDNDDLIIETNFNHLPKHFYRTLDRLNLNIFS